MYDCSLTRFAGSASDLMGSGIFSPSFLGDVKSWYSDSLALLSNPSLKFVLYSLDRIPLRTSSLGPLELLQLRMRVTLWIMNSWWQNNGKQWLHVLLLCWYCHILGPLQEVRQLWKWSIGWVKNLSSSLRAATEKLQIKCAELLIKSVLKGKMGKDAK